MERSKEYVETTLSIWLYALMVSVWPEFNPFLAFLPCHFPFGSP